MLFSFPGPGRSMPRGVPPFSLEGFAGGSAANAGNNEDDEDDGAEMGGDLFFSDDEEEDGEPNKQKRKTKALPADFLQHIKTTVTKMANYLDTKRGDPLGLMVKAGRYTCPLCPGPKDLGPDKRCAIAHIESQHTDFDGYTPSKKLARLALSVWHKEKARGAAVAILDANASGSDQSDGESDNDAGGSAEIDAEMVQNCCLVKAAKLLHDDIAESPSWAARKSTMTSWSNWDRYIRVVLDERPRFVLADDVDAVARHRISDHYWATDIFLLDFLATFIDPDVRAKRKTTIAKIRERIPRNRWHMIPTNPALFATVAKALMSSTLPRRIRRATREKVRLAVLVLDATFKVLLNVLYQVPFGAAKVNKEPMPNEVHVAMSLAGADGIYGMCTSFSEQTGTMEVLGHTLPEQDHRDEVLMIGTDIPDTTECPEVVDFFGPRPPGRRVIFFADAKHGSFRVQACSGEKETKMTTMFSRVLVRFRWPMSGSISAPYHKATSPRPPAASLLPPAYDNMDEDRARALIKEINAEDYTGKPIRDATDFIDAVAAIAHRFPDDLKRKNHKGRTVWTILKEFCTPVHVEYLLNGPRGLALHGLQDIAEVFKTAPPESRRTFHVPCRER